MGPPGRNGLWQLSLVRTAEGRRRYFLSADDLDQKAWLGADRTLAFEGPRSAFDTALVLRDEAQLELVVPPIRTGDGQSVCRITHRYTLAVFPFIDGNPGRFGDEITGEGRGQLLQLLAALHRATPIVASTAPRRGIELPSRPALEGALRDLHRPWEGGPFAEPARKQLAAHAEVVVRWLQSFDRLAEEIAAAGGAQVMTHGEPHGGNLLRAGGRLMLIDWDTVALAPPERDLWMLQSGSEHSLEQYAEAAGREPSPSALALYRLAWALEDVAIYVAQFRSFHERNEDTELAWRSLTGYLRDSL